MDGKIGIVVDQVIIFAILMAIGFVAGKLKVITKDGLKVLSSLIVKITLPALIFSIVAGSGVTINDFVLSSRFALGTLFCYAMLICCGIVMSKLCNLKGATKNIFIALFSFGNMGFIGIPLIQGVFNEPQAQVCISVYTIIDMALLWTLGVYLCSRHDASTDTLKSLKNMVNPTTVALAVAFVIVLSGVELPHVLMIPIQGLGNASKYLSLLYLGGALVYFHIFKALKKPSIFVIIAAKMVVIPISIYFIMGYFLNEIPRVVLTIIVGLPSMTTLAMVAAHYQSDEEYATEAIFLMTIACLLTIPVVSLITSLM